MKINLQTLVAALALGGALLGVGRYIGNMETRIAQLEKNERFLHGELK